MTDDELSNWSKYVSPNVYDGIRKLDPVKAKKEVEAFKEKMKKIEAKRAAEAKR